MALPTAAHGLYPKVEILLLAWQEGGWVGVDLFFVLSGFLVSALLFREHQSRGRIGLKQFLIRRGLKIYPAFWVFIACTVVFAAVRGIHIPWHHIASELLFVQNYVGPIWYHTWSLAVEEHFYIGLVVLFWLLLRGAKNRLHLIPYIFLGVAVLCLGLRLLTQYLQPTYAFNDWLAPTHLRVDSLLFGVCLSYFVHYHSLQEKLRAVRSSLLAALGVCLLVPAFIFPRPHHPAICSFGIVLFYLGSGALVLAATRLVASKWSIVRVCGALGAASYSIYLWHLAVNLLAGQLTGTRGGPVMYWTYLLIYVGGTLAFGHLMAKAVELPVLRVRDRMFPARAKPLPATTAGSLAPIPLDDRAVA
jgi:peptidoglycan/LPS O-acetylase OafA/YrhL